MRAMSYFALATNKFDEVTDFYGKTLGFSVVERWDRPHGRGRRFDIGGAILEILDNTREREPLAIGSPGERFHLVVEVEDIYKVRCRLSISAPEPIHVSWGAILFQLRDPDGIPLTFLQWTNQEGART
jgi:catechol 2,3-dioxygenase-like lactoylglutathione lyase family enzyme